jgi:hypothetical protein
MRTGVGRSWLAVGLLLGCGLNPSEVVGVYEGQGTSSSGASGDGPNSGGGSASTGPVADGSAGSGTGTPGTSAEGDTHAVDPSTTDPGTTSGDPPETTGPPATSDDPGSSSGTPPAPPTCNELFGTATDYVWCWEDDVSCGFSVNPGGLTCNGVCALFGATCIDNFDNPGAGEECVVQATEADCNSNLGEVSTICVCAK